MPADAPSIHALTPREHGGANARRGFAYQDHVAVAFFLQMLSDESLASVWCEAEDDITLIWTRSEGEAVEFVQVKDERLEQLWSAALICRAEPTGGSSSGTPRARTRRRNPTEPSSSGRPETLLEKSLAHDRCAEPCTFRVVTSTGLHPDLIVLTYPLAHEERAEGHPRIEAVVVDVVRLADRRQRFVSARGNDASYWVRRLVWDVRESEQALRNANRVELERFVASQGGFLAPDQREDLYVRLLSRAREAADAPWNPDRRKKKQARIALLEFMREEIRRAEQPSAGHGAARLRQKLIDAGLTADEIEAAWDLRQRYRAQRLSPTFLSLDEHELIETEVQARLHDLLTSLHAQELEDTPLQFHRRCMTALAAVRDELPVRVSLGLLQGAMYDITARCRHRFTQFSESELPPPGADSPSEAA